MPDDAAVAASSPSPGGAGSLTPEQVADLLSGNRARVASVAAVIPRAELRAHLHDEQGARGLREAFALMPRYYVPGQLTGELTVRWRVTRATADAIEYDLHCGPRGCTVCAAEAGVSPDAELVIDAIGFVELAAGLARGKDLLMRGDLRVRGDVQLAMRLEALFGLGAAGNAS